MIFLDAMIFQPESLDFGMGRDEFKLRLFGGSVESLEAGRPSPPLPMQECVSGGEDGDDHEDKDAQQRVEQG